MIVPIALGVLFAFVLVIAAVEWVRLVLFGYRWVVAVLASASPGAGAPSPDRQHITGPGSGSHPEGAQRPPTQEGVDGRGGVGYPARHYFSAGFVPVVFGVAMEPDFESFFGGFATAVAAGGVLLIAVVVVIAVRRFTSF
jgi:hypothetical protein